MFDALSEETFYEFPSFKVALFSILLSFVLSSVVAVTYQLTSRGSAFSRNFFQAMVLSSIVTCMVIMAVGNNLAAGFGIIGAIAIIRFRMKVDNPRNIVFIFAALSVGIAAGVYGYSIAIAGTAVFCLVVFLLFISDYGYKSLSSEFSLLFTLLHEEQNPQIHNILREQCRDCRMIKVVNSKRGDRYEYNITLKKHIDRAQFFSDLKGMEELRDVRMGRSDNLNRL